VLSEEYATVGPVMHCIDEYVCQCQNVQVHSNRRCKRDNITSDGVEESK
jgi:hypothetical protein